MSSVHWLASDTTSVLSFQLPRSRAIPYSTLFENNQYVKALNKALLLELGAIELYKKCAARLDLEEADGIIRNHQQQAKNLVNLIIFNRGIPEKKGFSLQPELGMLASGVSERLGSSFAFKTSRMSCVQMEKTLKRRYLALLVDAPYGDRSILNDHVKRSRQHVITLMSSAAPQAL